MVGQRANRLWSIGNEVYPIQLNKRERENLDFFLFEFMCAIKMRKKQITSYRVEFQLKSNADPPKSLLNDTALPCWLPKQLYCMNLKAARILAPAVSLQIKFNFNLCI